MVKHWTPEECEELKRTYIILSSRELANKFGTNQASIRSIRRRLRLRLPPEVKKERMVDAAYGTIEKRNKKKQHPFFGASIYVITYFAHVKKEEGLKTKIRGSADLTDILKDVAECLQVRTEDIRGDKKTQDLVNARQIFCYVAKIVRPEITNRELASFIGYSSHSNITTSLQRVKGYFKVNDSKFLETWFHYRANTKIYTKIKYKDHAI